MHPPPFPPEVWAHTVSLLPTSQQKSLLGVSRFFHDIALPFVFSSVKIYILGGYEVLEMLDTDNEAFASEIEQNLMHKSWEVLHRILTDSRFALVVRDMTIVEFSDYPAIFEILTLSKAFEALSNLHTLRFYGSEHHQPLALAQLIQAVPPSLQHLLYPSRISVDALDRLPHLKFLEYRNTIYFPKDSDYTTRPSPSGNTLRTLDFINSYHIQLHALSIDSAWIDRIPVWVYNNLTVLEMMCEDNNDIANFDFARRHCPNLEDLSITGIVTSGICLSLQETTFPRLRSFRLSCETSVFRPHSTEHVAALSRFIQSHKRLHRVYLRVVEADADAIKALLPALKELLHLEVLGFHTGRGGLDEDALRHVLAHFPLALKALHLAMSWNSALGNHVSVLTDALSQMPNLTFLHIHGIETRLPFFPEELAAELRYLTMVGLRRVIWDIDRTGPEIRTLKWPRRKTKFFVESDFHNSDDAWLFKYH